MKRFTFLSCITILCSTSWLASCSSNDSFDGGAGSGSVSNGGKGNNGSGANGGSSIITIGTGGTGTIGSENTCGTSDVVAELTPIYMVFVYDKSASMGVNKFTDTSGVTTIVDNTELRWKPVKAGMTDFFSNAKTTNVQASIAFFAYPGSKEVTCTHDYAVPDVSMTPLETPKKLVDALEAMVPEGGTPTLPAVIGGIKYAKKLMTDNPGSEAVVVLVTDGEPAIYNSATGKTETDCAPTGITLLNTVDDIASYVDGAYRGSPSIKTYVIGIGDVASLKKIAAAGTGNESDFLLIDPTDASATRQAILDKLTAIQPKRLSCNIALEKTVSEFDPDTVNVNFERSNGKIDQLSRSDACTQGGWRYDDADTPKFIELCKQTCDSIQADLDGKLKVVLGCPTRVIQ